LKRPCAPRFERDLAMLKSGCATAVTTVTSLAVFSPPLGSESPGVETVAVSVTGEFVAAG